MNRIKITFPEGSGCEDTKEIKLPTIPKTGEYIRGRNNRCYEVTRVIHIPFSHNDQPQISVTLDPKVHSPD